MEVAVVAAFAGTPKREGAAAVDAGAAPKFGRLVATLLAGIPKPVKPVGAAAEVAAGAVPNAGVAMAPPAKVRGATVAAAGWFPKDNPVKGATAAVAAGAPKADCWGWAGAAPLKRENKFKNMYPDQDFCG